MADLSLPRKFFKTSQKSVCICEEQGQFRGVGVQRTVNAVALIQVQLHRGYLVLRIRECRASCIGTLQSLLVHLRFCRRNWSCCDSHRLSSSPPPSLTKRGAVHRRKWSRFRQSRRHGKLPLCRRSSPRNLLPPRLLPLQRPWLVCWDWWTLEGR